MLSFFVKNQEKGLAGEINFNFVYLSCVLDMGSKNMMANGVHNGLKIDQLLQVIGCIDCIKLQKWEGCGYYWTCKFSSSLCSSVNLLK